MPQVQTLLRTTAELFVESDTALLDAQLLLGEVLGVDRAWLFTWPETVVSTEQKRDFDQLVQRRLAGEPVAYILGRREFWGMNFECNESTLIPRPDTETLVQAVLGLPLPDNSSILDLGTGTGCIAISLASERPSWNICATDVSIDAIALAKRNANRLDALKVYFFQSRWFDSVPANSKFDLIVSNPPYIDPSSRYLSDGDVRFEPERALVSEEAGFSDLREIIVGAASFLNVGGWLAFEHGFDQAERVKNMLADNAYSKIETVRDINGLERCTFGLFSRN